MRTGLLFVVIGATGVGKTTLIDGALAALGPASGFVQCPDLQTARDELKAGRHVLVEPSGDLSALHGWDHDVVVLEVTASRDVGALDHTIVVNDGSVFDGVAAMREALATATNRPTLRRMPIRAGRVNVAFLPSDGSDLAATYLGGGRIEIAGRGRSIRATVQTVEPEWHLAVGEIGLSAEAFDRLGMPEHCPVTLQRTPTPGSRMLLRRKIDGGRLTADEFETVFRDIGEDRYPDAEVTAFLLRAIQTLDDEEVIAVARARCRFTPRLEWGAPIVVDKHSLGGIPGSRITLIVAPIVAAHGMLMPKTSSRAITSASGTADAMECAAQVDLDAAAVRRAVQRAGACIAWSGRLNHSALDDVVNAITRPLGLDSNLWSVASILSKKWTAGSTHVVVDLPYGKRAKLKTAADARELGRIFELVGAGLGLAVKALVTDGSRAIGRGIGPALELRDVRLVLAQHPDAPCDLRDKALRFAGEILAFDPAVGDAASGRVIAERLLRSGAAAARFDAIVAAQGARAPAEPSRLFHVVRAATDGRVVAIDGWQIAGIARTAGAPADKSAGIDLLVAPGDPVAVGAALYRIHAAAAADLAAATAMASQDDGIALEPALPTAE